MQTAQIINMSSIHNIRLHVHSCVQLVDWIFETLIVSDDLLETVASVRCANMSLSSSTRSLGMIRVALDVPSLDDLIAR